MLLMCFDAKLNKPNSLGIASPGGKSKILMRTPCIARAGLQKGFLKDILILFYKGKGLGTVILSVHFGNFPLLIALKQMNTLK